MYIYILQYVCVFLNQNKAQFVIEYNIWLTNYSINPRQVPIIYKCRISCVLIRMAIDGSSAVQNEKIVFINNICSINQITVTIIVMQ